jgi:uncharacterized membrane protein
MALRHTRRLDALLITSLALNLFAGGVFAGGWLGPKVVDWISPRPPATALADFDTSEIISALPIRARARAAGIMADFAETLHMDLAALGPARAEVIAALAQDPFQPAEAAAALARLREKNLILQATVHQLVAEIARDLEPADRESFAQALFQRALDGVPLASLAVQEPRD